MATLTSYHWDPIDDCVLMESNQSGSTIATYTHDPGAFGSLLSENRSGTEYYHHYDALGSTAFLTNDSGAITDTFQYDAWGNSVARVGATPTPYQWVGRWGYQSDALSSSHNVRRRVYQQSTGRWTSFEPQWFFPAHNAPVISPVLLNAFLSWTELARIFPCDAQSRTCRYIGTISSARISGSPTQARSTASIQQSLLTSEALFNLYLYVDAQPATYYDPSGLESVKGCPRRRRCSKRNPPPKTTNGCTSPAAQDWTFSSNPWSTQYVVHVSDSCNIHDICYQTCGVSQSTCDREFYQNLNNQCAATIPAYLTDLRAGCQNWAFYYWAAVYFGATGAYNESQDAQCCCNDGSKKCDCPPCDVPEGGYGL